MLTPVEIQNRAFKSVGLGYDKKDVDSFMKEIVISYELLYREKMELADKVNVLNDALQNYKSIEKTLQKALVLAQKTAEETQEAAERKAHAIEKEAKTNAEIIVSDAKHEFDRVQQMTVQLCQQYEKYKLQFKNLAAAQIELLETESFQIHMMNYPTVELDSAKQTELPEEAPISDNEENSQKIDISFTNVASNEE